MDARTRIANASRLVVKIGSSSLTNEHGGLHSEHLDQLVTALARNVRAGVQLVLVSSGSIAAGTPALGLKKPPRDLATQQAAASVGQGILLAHYTDQFAQAGIRVGQVLLTAEDLIRRTQYRNAQRTLARLLELGVLPIVNENDTVATDEIRFGDNDRLAALVAHVVQADGLVLLTDIDGLYDRPPDQEGAEPLATVGSPRDLEGVGLGGRGSHLGRGGMVTKVQAALMASEAGIPVVLTHADQVSRALAGEPAGTVFVPSGKRRSPRQMWLAHATTARGSVRIDDGAVRALRKRQASLLAAGVVGVSGDFMAGEPVDILAPDGAAIARGLVAYDAAEFDRLVGRTTAQLIAEFGPEYEREVVHRDDLVLL
ncbi:MAG: glutamate 5-kinase [Candidatus Nanopelagicales bacterium]|jgi:glutamate 5-kinase|nr:glutamate 5-kinase [Candidatus Nanopelagicales bacterium]